MGSLIEIVPRTMLLAGLATLLVCLPGLPLAYLLARRDFPGKGIITTLISLPMVLPPTAIGYLLLQMLADSGPLGRDTLGFDPGILFTWKGVILACAVMSAPLTLRSAQAAFSTVNPRLEVMCRTLGIGRVRSFIRVTLPLAGRGLLAAVLLGYTRALGEFGATVMVAGNIPGRTQTLSSAIYSAQQSGNSEQATGLVILALLVGFTTVYTTEWLYRKSATTGRNARQ